MAESMEDKWAKLIEDYELQNYLAESMEDKAYDAFIHKSFQLISVILGDDSIHEIGWNERIELAKKALEKLNDPQFILKRLRSSIGENTSFKRNVRKAESGLESCFQQSNSIVTEHKCVHEIYDLLAVAIRTLQTRVAALQVANEESQSNGKEGKQETEQIIPSDWDSVENHFPGAEKGDEATGNTIANEVNMKLSPDTDETCIVHGYTVFKRNADALIEIFDEYPNVAESFRVGDPNLQSHFMNSLAELHQKIKSEPEMLEPKEITSMEVMVREMKLNGSQLSWLKYMLTKVRKRKRLAERIDSLRAKAKENEEKAKEAELELAKFKKKRRFQ